MALSASYSAFPDAVTWLGVTHGSAVDLPRSDPRFSRRKTALSKELGALVVFDVNRGSLWRARQRCAVGCFFKGRFFSS